MEKFKGRNTSFYNLSKILTILSILGAVIAAIFFAEDRFNQKKQFDLLNNKVEALRIRIHIYINEQNLESSQRRLIFLQNGKKDSNFYKYIPKDQVEKELNSLPNRIKQIEDRINELIRKEMEYDRYFQ